MKRIAFSLLLFQLLSSCQSGTNSAPEVVAEDVESTNEIASDTIPFVISEGNNIIFKVVLDQKDTLDFYFDTGGTELVMTHSAIKEKTSLLESRNEDYAEENYVPLEGYYSFSLNKLSWDSLSIYPTRIGAQEADGHFGWDLFEGKMVELDYEKEIMIIHTALPQKTDGYAKMEIEYINTLFCIKSSISIGEKEYPNRYLFDSGFQRAVVMDKDLREQSNFPDDLPVIKESRLKNAAGTEFVNRVVTVDKICFDQLCAHQVPVQLLSTPNPARFETHILGNELLKRFNTILDFQNGFVYMKPNSLMSLPYKDAS